MRRKQRTVDDVTCDTTKYTCLSSPAAPSLNLRHWPAPRLKTSGNALYAESAVPRCATTLIKQLCSDATAHKVLKKNLRVSELPKCIPVDRRPLSSLAVTNAPGTLCSQQAQGREESSTDNIGTKASFNRQGGRAAQCGVSELRHLRMTDRYHTRLSDVPRQEQKMPTRSIPQDNRSLLLKHESDMALSVHCCSRVRWRMHCNAVCDSDWERCVRAVDCSSLPSACQRAESRRSPHTALMQG